MISARQLTKVFDGYAAVGGIDVEVQSGECFGFLGPNGAGKSSTMRMIACVSAASGGELRVLGLDPQADGPAIRGRLGVVPQEDNLDLELSVWDNLIIYGRYFGLPRALLKERAASLLEFVQLTDRAAGKVDPLSGGMKRRLLVAKALVHNPPVLVLDEPTAGVDIELRQQLWDYVRALHAMGTTVVLTTHYLEEAEALCDRIAIVNNGAIVANDLTSVLLSTAGDKKLIVTVDRDLAEIPAGLGDRVELRNDRVLTLTYDKRSRNAGQVLAAVAAAGLGVVDVSTQEADLEDVFLDLTRTRG